MAFARMSTRGRVTIPKELREELGLKPGDRVAFYETAEGLIMEPVRGTLLDKMGSVKVEGRQDFVQVREEVKKKRGKLRGK
jgi:antitoxin PrlF